MPVEMTENGTLPDTKAMIVTSRMTSVISNGLIWVVLLWITSTLQMQSSGKGVQNKKNGQDLLCLHFFRAHI